MASHTLRALSTVIVLVCIGFNCIQTTEGYVSEDKALHAMKAALDIAHRALEEQTSLNEHLVRSGVDGGDKSDFGHAHMLNLFRSMKSRSVGDAEHAFVIVRATQELTRMLGKSIDSLLSQPKLKAMWSTLIQPFCTPRNFKCKMGIWRTADGSCNNLDYVTWGMSGRAQKRWLKPEYEDDIAVPRLHSVTGKPLPSPRLVSNIMHRAPKGSSALKEPFDTVMLMQWGQLVDHDIVDTPTLKGFEGADISCCGIKDEILNKRPACFSIAIPPHDPHFSHACMNFVRSTLTTNDKCLFGRRNQLNQATSYIDASYLYGADADSMRDLRAHKHGFMKTTRYGFYGPDTNQEKCMHDSPADYCQKSGDNRIHVVPGLSSTQIVFLREHNRIASILGKINNHWKDEKIFQETRKIIIALNQHINYWEYLPIILGPAYMAKHQLYSKPHGFDTSYDPTVDATMANSWAAAAFRFGHSQIPGHVTKMMMNGMKKSAPLQSTFNRPATIMSDGGKGCAQINRGMIHERAAKSDRFLEPAVRDYLFLDKKGESFDLAALNIQRGRDHGLPPYNAWRKWCGLQVAFHFGTGPGGLVDMTPEAAMLLSKAYKHPDDIDLFPGGLAERHMIGGTMGPVFACMNARQFKELKVGDRYWYENKFAGTGFTGPQLNEIKKQYFSSILCRNQGDKIIAKNVFEIPSKRNPHVPCKSLPDIDFGFWRDGPISDGPGQVILSPGPDVIALPPIIVPFSPIAPLQPLPMMVW